MKRLNDMLGDSNVVEVCVDLLTCCCDLAFRVNNLFFLFFICVRVLCSWTYFLWV